MKETLKKQLKCIGSYIEDKKIHGEFRDKKDLISLKQLEANVDLNRSGNNIEKKIRLCKVHKNQAEKIKINEVTSTCRQRN